MPPSSGPGGSKMPVRMLAKARSSRDASVVRRLNLERRTRKEEDLYGGTDAFLYAMEGSRVPVHKIVLMTCPNLRRILTETLCCRGRCLNASEAEPHIFLPDVSRRMLATVVDFLYTGVIRLNKSDVPELKDILMRMLGFPPNLPVSTNDDGNANNNVIDDVNIADEEGEEEEETYGCVLSCQEQFRARDLFPHFLKEMSEAQVASYGRIETCSNVTCVVCKLPINYLSKPDNKSRRMFVNSHYRGHVARLKKYILKVAKYKVDDSVDDPDESDGDDPRKQQEEDDVDNNDDKPRTIRPRPSPKSVSRAATPIQGTSGRLTLKIKKSILPSVPSPLLPTTTTTTTPSTFPNIPAVPRQPEDDQPPSTSSKTTTTTKTTTTKTTTMSSLDSGDLPPGPDPNKIKRLRSRRKRGQSKFKSKAIVEEEDSSSSNSDGSRPISPIPVRLPMREGGDAVNNPRKKRRIEFHPYEDLTDDDDVDVDKEEDRVKVKANDNSVSSSSATSRKKCEEKEVKVQQSQQQSQQPVSSSSLVAANLSVEIIAEKKFTHRDIPDFSPESSDSDRSSPEVNPDAETDPEAAAAQTVNGHDEIDIDEPNIISEDDGGGLN